MNKKLRGLCSAILMSVMVTGVLAGCSGKDSKDVANVDLGDSFNLEGMPIVKDEITIDVLTTRWGNMGDTFTKNKFLVDLEKESNVKIDWQVQSLNDWGEQKSILLASGELPSVIFGSETMKDTDILSNLEYFLPLDDLIDKYMPNYKKILENDPELKKLTTYPDGKIYSFGKRLPARPKVSGQLMINKKWLDNLNLEIPTTIEELNNVVRAFKEKDANGNGNPNDEIVISGSGSLNQYYFTPFGFDAIDSDMMLKEGKLSYAKTSEAYKEGLKWAQQMYKEGIIDPEIFTQDNTMLQAKNQDPNIARVGMSYEWVPDAVFGKWSDEYVAIAPIAGPDGKRFAYGDENGVGALARNEALITKFCKYPEVVARWIDQFYTDEASIQNFWGAIGTVIKKDANGNYSLLNPPAGTSADAWYWEQSTRDFGPKYASAELNDKLTLSPESGDGLKLEISKMGEEYIGTPYPKVMYTIEESEELATITTDIDKYVAEMLALWVSDSSIDIDAEWDSYVKQLNAMGLERLIEIRTEAYNRYIGE